LHLKLHDEIEWVFPFEGMSVGDSFFVPTLKTAPLIYAVETGAKRAEIKVKCFVCMKEGCLGVRVWRVK